MTMNTNMDMMRAGQLLTSGGYSCVLYRSGVSFTSYASGIKPLLIWLDSGVDYSGFFAADKIVGKGAAWIYIHLRVRGVYARTMTIDARDLLFAHGVAVSCDNYIERIMNRTGDGLCPFEAALIGQAEPDQALAAIKSTALTLFGDWMKEAEVAEEIQETAAESMDDVIRSLISGGSMEVLSPEDLAAMAQEEPGVI